MTNQVHTEKGLKMLEGKRTYIVALGAVVAALVGYLAGEMTVAEAVNAALIGSGLATLRAAK